MDKKQVIQIAGNHLIELRGKVFDVISLAQPKSLESAINMTKVISKLSPLVGNLIEFNTVTFLNSIDDFKPFGKWKRQDPGFPDTIFESDISPQPGIEIKTWFPLATEITARFKDSQNHFCKNQTYVAILAWLLENIIYGKPKIIDILIVSAKTVAEARDIHYHNPPGYLVLEPEDTSLRTRNLQQTNTNGYKFQGSKKELEEAKRIVASWGPDGKSYKPTLQYQKQLRRLIEKFKYRLDTNYAKMDRIIHKQIEGFKDKIFSTFYKGKTIGEWNKLLSGNKDEMIKKALRENLRLSFQNRKDVSVLNLPIPNEK
jgi:hypothetical protein